MQVEIKHLEAKNVAAFRLVGPWQDTAPQGFARLSEWVERHQLAGDWLAIYYDNPEIVPPNSCVLIPVSVCLMATFCRWAVKGLNCVLFPVAPMAWRKSPSTTAIFQPLAGLLRRVVAEQWLSACRRALF